MIHWLSWPTRWPSGKASASRAEDPGFESCWRRDFFGVESYQWLTKLALQWLPCQVPGVIGSVLGLVDLVSVYRDWVRWKVWSATFISVWQHVKLSEQIHPRDTLACCWYVKRPTNIGYLEINGSGFRSVYFQNRLTRQNWANSELRTQFVVEGHKSTSQLPAAFQAFQQLCMCSTLGIIWVWSCVVVFLMPLYLLIQLFLIDWCANNRLLCKQYVSSTAVCMLVCVCVCFSVSVWNTAL